MADDNENHWDLDSDQVPVIYNTCEVISDKCRNMLQKWFTDKKLKAEIVPARETTTAWEIQIKWPDDSGVKINFTPF